MCDVYLIYRQYKTCGVCHIASGSLFSYCYVSLKH